MFLVIPPLFSRIDVVGSTFGLFLGVVSVSGTFAKRGELREIGGDWGDIRRAILMGTKTPN